MKNVTALLEDPLYHDSYSASISVLKNIVPFLADADGAATRLSKAVKGIPILVAQGSPEREQNLDRSCALSEAAAFCREAVVILSYCRDLHGRFISGALCTDLIETYRSIGDRLCTRTKGIDSKGEEQN